MPECPVDGCETSFAEASSVRAHVQGSSGIHKGLTFADAEQALEAGEKLKPQGTNEGSGGGEQGSGEAGGEAGEGIGVPSVSEGSGGSGDDVEELPCCGETFSTDEFGEGTIVVCETCGKYWRV